MVLILQGVTYVKIFDIDMSMSISNIFTNSLGIL